MDDDVRELRTGLGMSQADPGTALGALGGITYLASLAVLRARS